MRNNGETFLLTEFNLAWVKTFISGKYLAVELPCLIMPFQINTLHSSLYIYIYFFFAKCMDVLYNNPIALAIQGLLSL